MPIPIGVLAQAGAGAGPTPPVAGPLFWYDANLASSLTLSGSNVTQINDLSGNGRHAKQATAANQPTTTVIDGETYLNFDGGDFLVADDNVTVSNLHVFMVGYYANASASGGKAWGAWTGGNPALSKASNAVYFGLISATPSTAYIDWGSNSGSGYQYFGTGDNFGTRRIYMQVRWSNGVGRLRDQNDNTFNGTDNTGSPGAGKWVLGGNGTFGQLVNGQVGEVLIYESLTDANADIVKDYLYAKWF